MFPKYLYLLFPPKGMEEVDIRYKSIHADSGEMWGKARNPSINVSNIISMDMGTFAEADTPLINFIMTGNTVLTWYTPSKNIDLKISSIIRNMIFDSIMHSINDPEKWKVSYFLDRAKEIS